MGLPLKNMGCLTVSLLQVLVFVLFPHCSYLKRVTSPRFASSCLCFTFMLWLNGQMTLQASFTHLSDLQPELRDAAAPMQPPLFLAFSLSEACNTWRRASNLLQPNARHCRRGQGICMHSALKSLLMRPESCLGSCVW